jgi:hypothetical protein
MITFSNIGNYGRLGNQLFQYAILKSISLKNNFDIVLPTDTFSKVWHGQRCLLNNFKLPSCNLGNVNTNKFFFESGERNYDTSIFSIEDGTDVFGFFQNPLYYTNIREELIKEFELINIIQNKVDNYLSQFKNNTVSLHIRRGDASDGTNPVDDNWVNDFSENSILYNYYTKSLDLIPKDSTVLLFTGGSRISPDNTEDIIWCRDKFKDDRIVFVDGLSDIECFGVMKNCDYNITSFSSTFSWWASFLNKKNTPIAPINYYPSHNFNPKDVYPEDWILL